MNSILGQGAAWPNGKKQRDWRNYKVPSCSIFKWQEMRLWDEILSSKVSYKTRFLTELLNLALRTKSSENICAFFTSLCTRNVGINMVVTFRKLRLAKEKWCSDTLSCVAYKKVVDCLQLKKSSFSLNFNNF